MIFFICFYCFDKPPNPNGTTSGLYSAGSIVYAGAVIIANIKIMQQYNNYNLGGVVLALLSIASYFLIFYLESLPFLGISGISLES